MYLKTYGMSKGVFYLDVDDTIFSVKWLSHK